MQNENTPTPSPDDAPNEKTNGANAPKDENTNDTPNDDASTKGSDAPAPTGANPPASVPGASLPDPTAEPEIGNSEAREQSPTSTDQPGIHELRGMLVCSDPGCQCHSDDGYVHCPAHDELTPSFDLFLKDGKIRFNKCHRGCAPGEVGKALARLIEANAQKSQETAPDDVTADPAAQDSKALTVERAQLAEQLLAENPSRSTEWPSASTLRVALRCSNAKCPCQRDGRDVHCPAHDDRRPSLSLNESAEDGKPLWKCRAGCTQGEVTAALRHVIATDPLIAQIALCATSADPMLLPPSSNETHSREISTNNEQIEPINREQDEPISGNHSDAEAPDAEAPDAEALDAEALQDQHPKQLLKTLRERGITNETRKHFNIAEYYQSGVAYPADHPEDYVYRIKSCVPHLPAFFWNDSNGDWPQPKFYNSRVIFANDDRMDHGLYLVQGEADVWIMHQNGFAALSFIGNRSPRALAKWLVKNHVHSVNVIFDNNLAGRRALMETWESMRELLDVHPLLLEGAHGLSVTTLFERVGFDEELFCDEIETLRRVPHRVFKQWAENPESMREGLSEAEDDGLLQCLDEDELAQLPHPQALVEDTLLAQGATLMTGTHASGKSFVALDMALSISQGQPWQGKKTQSGAAFYFSGEGTEGLSSRIRAWKQTHGVAALPNFAVVNGGVYIVDPAVRRRAIDTVRARLQKMNLAPDGAALLVFDTLARYRGALDESSPTDMGQFTDAAEEIGRELGAAVLVVHHNNRDGTFRGSSVLPANAVGHLEISNPPSKGKGMQIKIRVSKMKDFAQGHSLTLGSQVVEIGGVDKFGKPLTSLVLTLDSGPQTNGEQLSLKESDALQVLVDFGAAGAKSTVWKKAASDKKKVAGTTFDRAKSKLLELGAVMCDTPTVANSLHKAVEGWSDLPAENSSKSGDDDSKTMPPLRRTTAIPALPTITSCRRATPKLMTSRRRMDNQVSKVNPERSRAKIEGCFFESNSRAQLTWARFSGARFTCARFTGGENRSFRLLSANCCSNAVAFKRAFYMWEPQETEHCCTLHGR